MIAELLSVTIGSLPFACLKAQFMQRAILEILLLAPLCALMGTLTISFKMAFYSDAIAHSAFTGIALGILLGIDPWLSLVVFAVFFGILTSRLKRFSNLTMDTTLGVLFSANIAFGLVVISMKKGLGKGLQGFLYGDVLSISENDLLFTMGLLGVVLVFVWNYFNRLIFVSVHQELAKSTGIDVEILEQVFASILSIVVAFSIRTVGILLVTALLIIPSAAASNIAGSVKSQVWFSILFAVCACLSGFWMSVTFDSATGPSIILSSTVFFGITLIARRK